MRSGFLRCAILAARQGLVLYKVYQYPIRRYVLSRADWGDPNIEYMIFGKLREVHDALRIPTG